MICIFIDFKTYAAPHSRPYINITKCGTKEIVKASLFRLSLTQNRIFSFDIDARFTSSSSSSSSSKYKHRKSIDMNEDLAQFSVQPDMNANELLKGQSLFNKIKNKDVLRVVCTVLWDSSLANNVLEEFLQAPRFSMFGIHAQKIAKEVVDEFDELSSMNFSSAQSHSSRLTDLPSPSRAPSQLATKRYTYKNVTANEKNFDSYSSPKKDISSNVNTSDKSFEDAERISDHYENDYEDEDVKQQMYDGHPLVNDEHVSDHQLYYEQQQQQEQQQQYGHYQQAKQFETIEEEDADYVQEEPVLHSDAGAYEDDVDVDVGMEDAKHKKFSSVIEHEKFSTMTSQIRDSGIFNDDINVGTDENDDDEDDDGYQF